MGNLAELEQSLGNKIVKSCWGALFLGTITASFLFVSPFTIGTKFQFFIMVAVCIISFSFITYLYKRPTKVINSKYYINALLIIMIISLATTLRNPEIFGLFYFIMVINLSYRDRTLHFASSAIQLFLYITASLYMPILFPAASAEDTSLSLTLTRVVIFIIVVLLADNLNAFSLQLTDKLIEKEQEVTMAALADSVGSLIHALEAKDEYTNGHSQRSSRYALIISRDFELTHNEKIFLTGCLLHDIGKIGLPDKILVKKTRLSTEEFSLIKEHPLVGAKILEEAKSLKEIIPMVLYHHEKYDGSGYPHGLKGIEIPLEARILAVADAFDAMTSNRPYRIAMSPDEAYQEILAGTGSQFCPTVVDAFKNTYEDIYQEYLRTHHQINCSISI